MKCWASRTYFFHLGKAWILTGRVQKEDWRMWISWRSSWMNMRILDTWQRTLKRVATDLLPQKVSIWRNFRRYCWTEVTWTILIWVVIFAIFSARQPPKNGNYWTNWTFNFDMLNCCSNVVVTYFWWVNFSNFILCFNWNIIIEKLVFLKNKFSESSVINI